MMASVYRKKTGIYYISVMFQNKRISRSLGTHSLKTAKMLIPEAEKQMLVELLHGKQKAKAGMHLSLPALYEKYLAYPNHGWADTTHKRYCMLLKHYSTHGMPDNPTTKAMTVRVLNACNNWAYKHALIDKPVKLNGGNKWKARHRVFTKPELDTLFEHVNDASFNQFVRFAYYSGARSGEIRCLSRVNVFFEYTIAYGKTGARIIKLNAQARSIISQQKILWNYSKDYISHKFKKECRRLGIRDARFHDLRRTFGYNLIKQGKPIYEVSKLLGHASVTTTEKHYAPLLTTEIEDFIL